MIIKFFIYNISNGKPFVVLEDLPDNYMTMLTTREVVYDGNVIARGVKFDTGADWYYNGEGFSGVFDNEKLEWNFKYISGEIIYE